VLLYIILSKKSVAGGGAMASSADDLSQSMQRQVTIGGRTFNTFADKWENSVGFRRWAKDAEVQDSPYTDPKLGNKDPLDPRNLVFGWADSIKRQDMSNPTFGFTGVNRVANVFSVGRDQAPGTPDDMLGYRLRRHGN
jgi:hypothetical protein